MTDTQRSFLTAGIVCAAAASVVGGIAAREAVDVGSAPTAGRPEVLKSSLMASRTIDTDIPEGDYFAQMVQLLKREYYEPIDDEVRLASGAVRGMVSDLGDVRCLYLDRAEMSEFDARLRGSYEGIGADLDFVRASTETAGMPMPEDGSRPQSFIPKLVVAFVVPGGPADRAGVKPGDWVDGIDGRWVVNPEIIERARLTQRMVQEKKWPAQKLQELQKELRQKSKSSISPLRARDRLLLGKEGAVAVTWNRAGAKVATGIQKSTSSLAPIAVSNGSYRLRFVPGVEKELAKAARGRSQLSIDLRGNAVGDAAAMEACLAAVAPSGSYGELAREGGKPARVLRITIGNPRPPRLTILVDAQTRGAAEVFARALEAKGKATIVGKSAGDPSIVELHRLPDGAGYTLVTGMFKPTKGARP